MKKKIETIGGQAVLEGVMMKSREKLAVAVRDENGTIQLTVKNLKPTKNKFFKLPLVRGFVSFCQMLYEGMGLIDLSAKMAFNEEQEESGLMSILGILLGFILAIGLFIFLPTFLVSFFFKSIQSNLLRNLLEGLFRLSIFVAYLMSMSAIKDMKRFFMYHGAEHKTITCSEKGLNITVSNAKPCSRLHPRCGTTFMFLLMIISILVFSLIVWTDNILLRTGLRVMLLPVVSGISYEVLRWAADKDNFFVNLLKFPGFMLQKLTTKEPDSEMLEVAIVSFLAVKYSKEELDAWRLSENGIDFNYYKD